MSCEDNTCKPSDQNCEKPDSGCEMTDMMMCLANDAWADLMKEKMKAELEKARGAKMNKVAAAAVQASITYWEHKMAGKMKCHEAKESMKQAFMS